ncbi:MAG TPA: MarR family transcriptional regulator [Kofleriaceae bacterium]|nr:MarR family transcriptional regulator [Kofleriaceae bacterium]
MSGIDDLTLRVADAVGAVIEFWGFKRNMGRMWALLYLERKPLSAADLGERLSLSSGAVSMALADLQQWGVVKKAWVPGERRDYFEAETGIWKMVSRVFRERELRQIRESIETFEEVVAELERTEGRGDDEANQRTAFALDRLRGLLALARIAAGLLDAVLSGQAIDIGPLKGVKS